MIYVGIAILGALIAGCLSTHKGGCPENSVRDHDIGRCRCERGWLQDAGACVADTDDLDGNLAHDDSGAMEATIDASDGDIEELPDGEGTDGALAEAGVPVSDAGIDAMAAADGGSDASAETSVPDRCADFSNGCKPAYPCTLTTPTAGYTCLGQYADWPMPDNAGPLKLNYETKTDEVVDNITELTWQRVLPATYSGCVAGSTCSWGEATRYCQGLALAGHEDWRLPSKVELESIVDEMHTAPPTIDSAFSGTPAAFFWTSSPYAAALESSVWAVSFADGISAQMDTPPIITMASERAYVRCVRGARATPDEPSDRYSSAVVAKGREVFDKFTGLTWLLETDRTFRSWSDAVSHCTSHGGGYRLPAYKELLTLVDPTRANPALDTQVFLGLIQDWFYFWSSSVVDAGQKAWQLNILYGQGLPEQITSTSLGVCVR